MRSKQKKGEYISCFTYGYKPSPENKHKMVIDEPAAEIVREVFNAIIAGKDHQRGGRKSQRQRYSHAAGI